MVHSAITNRKTFDGFTNVHRGLGSKRDITSNTFYSHNKILSMVWKELDDLYSSSWVAANVVDVIVEDTLKDDREFECEDADKKELFCNALEDYEIMDKISDALTYSKIFGSAFMIIVANDDEMDMPLNISKISQGGLKNIAVLDRFDLYPDTLNRNPLSPRYLEPDYYMLSKGGRKIHHTRVIKLDGIRTTNYKKELLQGFGMSVYERLFKTILNAELSPNILINTLTQANTDVFKILGLNQNLKNGDSGDAFVLQRLQAIMDGKSIFNGIALDKEDEYNNITKNFSGLEGINKSFYEVVSAAAKIPFSRFMGAQLSGLNPTGEGELKTYYDRITAERSKLTFALNKIDAVIQMHLFGERLDYKWEFPSLFKMTPLQAADIESKNAQTKQIYYNMGAVNEFEVRADLVDNPLFPTITAQVIQEEKEAYSELDE